MLSSQTKDQVTFAAMEKFKAYGLTKENILPTSTSVSNVLVYSQISPNVQSPYGHGPQKYNTVAQSEAHSENSQSTRSLFT